MNPFQAVVCRNIHSSNGIRHGDFLYLIRQSADFCSVLIQQHAVFRGDVDRVVFVHHIAFANQKVTGGAVDIKDGIRHFEVIYLKLLAPIEINGLHILRYREAMCRHVLACFVLPPIDHTRILRRVGLKIDERVIHEIYVIGITVHPVGVERDIEALRHIYKICRLQNVAALFYGVEPRYKLAVLHPAREKLVHGNHGIKAEERFLIREQVFFGTDRRVLVFVKDGRRIDGGVFFFDLLGKQEETHLLNGIRHEILAPCTFLRKAIFCADHNIQIGYIFRQRNREILNPRFAVIV